MTDKMNEVRAIRLAEIVSDYRRLLHYIAQVEAHPTPEEYNGSGYSLLRQCTSEARAILGEPFTSTPGTPEGDSEAEKAELKHIILDASARRFQVHRIYLRSTAAMRWINCRSAILQGNDATIANASELQAAEDTLHAELATITNERVFNELKSQDYHQGKWIVEDPTLLEILGWIAR